MPLDVLAIGAHPDDVEIGCGGALINITDAGYRVGIADLTNALLSSRGTDEIRQREAKDGAEIIGAGERYQLGFHEGSISQGAGNLEVLVTLIRRTRPLIIFAPYSFDRHPDHMDASDLVHRAAFWAGVAKYGDGQSPHRPHRLIYYHVHWEGPVSIVVDISACFDRKLKAIRAYRSQFLSQPGDGRMTYISRPEFLEKLISRARYYGAQIGAEYGEPFYLQEMIRVDDPVKWC